MKRLLLSAALLACVLPAAAHGPEADLSAATLAQIADARRATAPFHDLAAAIAAGYGPSPFADAAGITCIDKPGEGAMGIHYVNGGLLTVHISPLAPQALIYEPIPGGTLRLVGAEYIVFKSAWDGAFPGKTPMLFDQPFHLVPEGNRYGLPPFYALHLWLWQPNRSGMFADWNPAVRCR
jgi:hypothetical protein